MKEIIIADSCLRDGNHSVNNNFTLEDIGKIVGCLDAAGVDYIEIGYGYGLGSSDSPRKPGDIEIIKWAQSEIKNSQLAILVFPNYASLEQLREVIDMGLGMVRVSIQALNAEPAEDYIKLCLDHGVNVGAFMMMSHRASVEQLVEEAEKLESYGVKSITIADSAGFMETNEVREKITALRKALADDIIIGFHGHDNLGLAVGNSIAAIESGVDLVDTALGGLGAGAGNTPTESLVAVLNKGGYITKSDLFGLLDGAGILKDIAKKYGTSIQSREDTIMLGYSGAYSTFMKPAKEISLRHQVDYRELLIKAAERSLVPGQEAKLLEIAWEIKN